MLLDTIILYVLLTITTASAVSEKQCVNEDENTLRCNYIPTDIPNVISTVRIVNFEEPNVKLVINETTFSFMSWDRIRYLELRDELGVGKLHFTARCFTNLKSLHELQLHFKNFSFDPDMFVGLKSVKSLDLSNCVRFSINNLIQSLNGTDKIPNLEKLTMKRLDDYHGPNILDERLGEVLQQKMVTYIDLSDSEITKVYLGFFRYLKHLEFLNISSSTVGDTDKTNFTASELSNVKMFDLCHAILPKRLLPPSGKIMYSNLFLKNPRSLHEVLILLTPGIVNISAIMPVVSFIFIHNCTFIIDKPLDIHTRELVAQRNNFIVLDLNLRCINSLWSSIENIDLSHNGLEFLSPSITLCIPNLKMVDLSNNRLYKMAEYNVSLFECLFKSLPHLQFLRLSTNNLEIIPLNMFENNFALESVDLSGNKINQVTFSMYHLDKLKRLDLQSNNIHILDEISLNHLISILHKAEMNETHTTVLLMFNPISCSKCESKPFLQWLITSSLVDVTSQILECTGEHGHKSKINAHALHIVQNICDRVTIIVVSSTLGIMVILLIIGIILLVHRHWKKKRRLERMDRAINLLRNGDLLRNEFVAFLAYSSADDDFVTENVLDKLEENLQRWTGIERQLICTGDRYLRPGFYVLDETIVCFDRVSVVIVVVSNNFCNSSYCCNEFSLALESGKPIVLMFKEHVDEQIMPDAMKRIYQRNTRILWTIENGEYILKTSWNNVSTALLDLVQ